MPVFSPSSGGWFMPIGRDSGVGVNSSTRFPYARGALDSWAGASSDFSEGVARVGCGLGFVSLPANLVYEVLNVRHWHLMHGTDLAPALAAMFVEL
jgi:hypothetical protein